MKRRFWARKVVGILMLVIIGIIAFGSLVMLLWNSLMPVIFHLPLITFWQALGLFLLTKILFSGFRGGPRSHWKRHSLKEGWARMTPEQQDKFRQEWGRRCGKPFPPDRQPGRDETVSRSADPAASNPAASNRSGDPDRPA